MGLNNGVTKDGVRRFSCADGHGIFLKADALELAESAPAPNPQHAPSNQVRQRCAALRLALLTCQLSQSQCRLALLGWKANIQAEATALRSWNLDQLEACNRDLERRLEEMTQAHEASVHQASARQREVCAVAPTRQA